MVRGEDRLRCFAMGGGTIESIDNATSFALVMAATAMVTVES